MDDDAFIAAFRRGDLAPSCFSHEGHVRLAWLYLTSMPRDEATTRFVQDLQRFVEGVGEGDKFHRTITEALLRVFASHLPEEESLSWQAFIARHPIVVEDALGLLARHYSRERLFSDEARKSFVEPDVKPLPT